jgi:putative restriction endonuclease
MDAAHIMPVAANCPDIVGDGLALSGAVHGMFDLGLVGVKPI